MTDLGVVDLRFERGSTQASRVLARRYGEALRAADSDTATATALEGLEREMSPPEVYARVIQPAMYWIGDLWRHGAIGVGDEYLATAISEKVLAAIYPVVLDQRPPARREKVLLAGAAGEEHSLGLRMVADTLEGRGHPIEYLGPNVSIAAILDAVRTHNPMVVALSVTMTPNAAGVVSTIDALSGWPVRIAVGGQAAPAVYADSPFTGLRSVLDLPDVEELPLGAEVGGHLRAGNPQAFRRDLAGGAATFPDEGGAGEAELAKVVSDTADMVRVALRSPGEPAAPTAGDLNRARERSDLEVVSDLFAAIDRKDVEGALRMIHPNVSWSPTAWSGARVLRGREAVKGWFDQFGPELRDLRIDLAEIRLNRGSGPRGWTVVLGTVHDARGSEPFSTRVGWRFAVQDGLVAEGQSHQTWEEALEAAGCEPSALTSASRRGGGG